MDKNTSVWLHHFLCTRTGQIGLTSANDLVQDVLQLTGTHLHVLPKHTHPNPIKRGHLTRWMSGGRTGTDDVIAAPADPNRPDDQEK